MNPKKITNYEVLTFIENASELFQLRASQYKNKAVAENFGGLLLHRSGFYGIQLSDESVVPLERSQYQFQGDVTIFIEGYVNLPIEPVSTGSITYAGIGILEVNDVQIYNGYGGGSGAATWGDLTGNIEDQLDLIAKLGDYVPRHGTEAGKEIDGDLELSDGIRIYNGDGLSVTSEITPNTGNSIFNRIRSYVIGDGTTVTPDVSTTFQQDPGGTYVTSASIPSKVNAALTVAIANIVMSANNETNEVTNVTTIVPDSTTSSISAVNGGSQLYMDSESINWQVYSNTDGALTINGSLTTGLALTYRIGSTINSFLLDEMGWKVTASVAASEFFVNLNTDLITENRNIQFPDEDGILALKGSILYGASSFTLDGIQTVFTIPHGMGTTPSSFSVTFRDAGNLNFVQSVRTIDGTNITFTCNDAPAAGSQTVYWQVFK